jgi:protoporphyrinogen IX oxidase
MLWIKAAHIVAVIAWMAALLYLPRLMVYHAATKPGSEVSETFKVMERRLLRAIATPAMAASWVFGLWLAFGLGVWGEPWFLAKLALVLGLSAYHGLAASWVRDFAEDRNRRPQRFYRVVNEVPAVIMAAIVVLAVVKPF